MLKRVLTSSALLMPCTVAAPAQPAPTAKPTRQQLSGAAHTLYVHANSDFLTADTLDRALLRQQQWQHLNLALVATPATADLTLEIDPGNHTHAHTFVLTNQRTHTVLAAARQRRALDGPLAANALAQDIVTALTATKTLPH